MYTPYNAITGECYNGSNIIALSKSANKMKCLNDPRWLTFLQAKQLGLRVKKGEHGTKIRYCGRVEASENEETGEKIKGHSIMRMYTVFHASQIEGMKPFEN